MGLEGKVALVTGVTSGLGRATVRVFLSRGARVVGSGRRAALGEELAAEVAELGDFAFVEGDVKVVADCERMVNTAVERFGRLDILINNAGTSGNPPVVDTHEATEAWYDDILDINLKGTFFCSRYALAPMLEGGSGVIINISSVSAVEAHSHMAAYSASKAAVVQLSRALAVEYVTQNIRVNAVVLGGVKTDMADSTSIYLAQKVRGPDFVPAPIETDNNFFLMDPEQVGRTLAMLCDDDASTITGATINIDKTTTAGFMYSTVMYMTTAELWKV